MTLDKGQSRAGRHTQDRDPRGGQEGQSRTHLSVFIKVVDLYSTLFTILSSAGGQPESPPMHAVSYCSKTMINGMLESFVKIPLTVLIDITISVNRLKRKLRVEVTSVVR